SLSHNHFYLILRRPLISTLFPYTTLFRSRGVACLKGPSIAPQVALTRVGTLLERNQSQVHTCCQRLGFELFGRGRQLQILSCFGCHALRFIDDAPADSSPAGNLAYAQV